ncbi:transposase [Deinococcus terrestris]|uniref:transposase n=1 Tax=Deinococcus terrestris TaxID=2651870 RepID=UPI001883DA78|nr:transposase [Deinococcus terrestris]
MLGKRYTEQQILDILGQLEARTPISDLTRLHAVAMTTIYRWKAKYGGMTKDETRKFRQLEAENQRLKKLVADLSLDNATLKEVVGRKW